MIGTDTVTVTDTVTDTDTDTATATGTGMGTDTGVDPVTDIGTARSAGGSVIKGAGQRGTTVRCPRGRGRHGGSMPPLEEAKW